MDAQQPTDAQRARTSLRGRGREILLGAQSSGGGSTEAPAGPPVTSSPAEASAVAPSTATAPEARRSPLDPAALPLTADETAALLDFSPMSPVYRLDTPFLAPRTPAEPHENLKPHQLRDDEPNPLRPEKVVSRRAPAAPDADPEPAPPHANQAASAAASATIDGQPLGERSPAAAALGDDPPYAARPEIEQIVPPGPEQWAAPAPAPDSPFATQSGAPATERPQGPRTTTAGWHDPERPARSDAPSVGGPADERIVEPASAIIQRPARALFDRAASSESELLDLLVDDERIRKLARQIEALQEDLAGRSDGARANADLYLDDLARASKLLRSSRANFDDARAIVCRVRADMTRQQRIEADIRRFRPRLLVYFILWGVVLVGLFVVKAPVTEAADELGVAIVSALYYPVLFGVGGALLSGFLALDRHTSKLRDFDPMHISWYLVNPLMGGVIGLLMFALAALANEDLLREEAATAEYAITYLLCVVVGMNQSHVFRRLEDLLKRIGRSG